jgi:hypothetical protein
MLSPAAPSARDLARRYLTRLEEHNGEVGATARTLALREPRMKAAEALALTGLASVDRATYERNLERRRPEPGLGSATLWALCLAKASAAESFGAAVGTNFDAAQDEQVARILAHIEAEETYHARTARCLLAGLGLSRVPPPPDPFTRALVRVMAGLPEAWGGGIVVYSGEVTAAALFRLLRASLTDVFDQPSAQHARQMLDQVVSDEEAHACFAWSRLSRVDRALCLLAVPLATRLIAIALPEATLLFGERLASEVRAVESVAQRACQDGRGRNAHGRR